MSRSVRSPNADLVSFELLIDDAPPPDDIVVRSFEVDQGLNRLPRVRIVVEDGNATEQAFDVSSASLFVPGAGIALALGYHGQNTRVFQGIVLAQSIRIEAVGSPVLIVTCGDRAEKLARLTAPDVGDDLNDEDMVAEILQGAGLDADLARMSGRSAREVRQGATAWDCLLGIASANGLVVSVGNGRVALAAPSFDAPVLFAAFGDSILGLELSMNAATQDAAVRVEAFDAEGHERISATASEPSVNAHGNLTGKVLSRALDVTRSVMSDSAMQPERLQAWADAILFESRLSRVTGEVLLPGNADLVAGHLLELNGLGDRFNGNAYLTSVRHIVESGAWQTSVFLGFEVRV